MEPAEAIESPGSYLKAKRESLRLSLKNVADAIRVREAVLREMEEDNYADMSPLYVKSFLSAYAKCLGIDPNHVILLHQKYVEKSDASKSPVPRHRLASRKKRVNVRLLVITLSALLLLVVIAYISFKVLW